MPSSAESTPQDYLANLERGVKGLKIGWVRNWYDGDERPAKEIQALIEDAKMPEQGSILIGTKGVMLIPHVAFPVLFPRASFKDFKLPEVAGVRSRQTPEAMKAYEHNEIGFNFPFPWQQGPRRMGTDKNGDTLWVGNSWGGSLSKIDVKTGEILHKVEVQGFGWPESWNVTPRPRVPHGCPSHGIALTNDEKEVWLCDGINNDIHIFDNTTMPPRPSGSIKTSAGPFWIMVGLDGRLAYCSSGDVIDVKSRRIVGKLRDEYGRPMYSEKMLDMVFTNGRLTRVANQFGNGLTAVPPSATPGRQGGN
mgnify:CR=1 FL=1